MGRRADELWRFTGKLWFGVGVHGQCVVWELLSNWCAAKWSTEWDKGWSVSVAKRIQFDRQVGMANIPELTRNLLRGYFLGFNTSGFRLPVPCSVQFWPLFHLFITLLRDYSNLFLQQQLKQQDEGLDMLSKSADRLGALSLGISEELGQQNKWVELHLCHLFAAAIFSDDHHTGPLPVPPSILVRPFPPSHLQNARWNGDWPGQNHTTIRLCNAKDERNDQTVRREAEFSHHRCVDSGGLYFDSPHTVHMMRRLNPQVV